jgi:GNAT superfamily N-acetyltransferase
MHIRPGKVSDAAAVARVQVDTWRTAYAGIMPDEVLEQLSYERSTERWQNNLSSTTGFFYLAENDSGEVVGFAIGGREREGNTTYEGEIYAIYVLEAYQVRGIGRQLVAAMAQRLLEEQIDSMLIWVLADNPSRAFYEVLGGELVYQKKDTIRGVVMDKAGYGWRDLRPLIEIERRS